ncbi:DUF3833 family protein [Spiribacter sp. C176]|uniref:DUF3833 family protein n=1 Tax=Spiribacter salilacus TaxID=2664894 RepID=A0A6N7QQU6_9GAMM|nr:DUF3833 domain-containing protein [Spiribacter salilacus]MRH78791.1 DUF3833 family protein [Spiribacter salilacus]
MWLTRLYQAAVIFIMVSILTACAGVSPDDYADQTPEFLLEEYFDGQVKAWGMFQTRNGKVQRRFTVDIDGQVNGDQIILDEHFEYDDGKTERRVWEIERIDEQTYRGTAGDVVGSASGVRSGNALNWSYVLALDVGDQTWNLKFNDWMYLIDDEVLINTADVTKFGFRVGRVTLFFQRNPQANDSP